MAALGKDGAQVWCRGRREHGPDLLLVWREDELVVQRVLERHPLRVQMGVPRASVLIEQGLLMRTM